MAHQNQGLPRHPAIAMLIKWHRLPASGGHWSGIPVDAGAIAHRLGAQVQTAGENK